MSCLVDIDGYKAVGWVAKEFLVREEWYSVASSHEAMIDTAMFFVCRHVNAEHQRCELARNFTGRIME